MKQIIPILFLLFSATQLQAQVKVTFILEEHTAIQHDSIFVTGTFSNWDSTANPIYLMKPQGERRKAITISLKPGAIRYKFHRGGWLSVEKYFDGTEVPDRVVTIGKDTVLKDDVRAWRDQFLLDKWKTLSMPIPDTSRIRLLSTLAILYGFNFDYLNTDSAFYYAQQAFQVVQKLKTPNYAKERTDDAKIATLLQLQEFTAALLHSLGNYSKALEIRLENLKLAENTNDKLRLAWALGNITSDYYSMKDYRNMLNYAKQQDSVLTMLYRNNNQKNQVDLSRSKFNVANSYYRLNELPPALEYAKQSLRIDSIGWWQYLNGRQLLGDIYAAMNVRDSAMSNYRFIIANTPPWAGSFTALAEAGMAREFHKAGRIDSALFYGRKALRYYQNNEMNVRAWGENSLYYIGEISPLLAALYKANNQPDSAYKYLQLSIAAKDSLYNADKMRQFQTLSFNEANRRLQTEQQIREANQRYKTQLKMYGLIGIITGFMALAFVLYRNNRQKQKTNAALQSKNRELEFETALERVRARAMAMRVSQEFSEVVVVLFQQLESLGVDLRFSYITISNKSGWVDTWYTEPDGSFNAKTLRQSIEDDVYMTTKAMEAFAKNEDFFFSDRMGKVLSDYIQLLEKDSTLDVSPLTNALKKDPSACFYQTQAFFKYGFVGYASFNPRMEGDLPMLRRFAMVVEQTYTRFLDLQKAEAQAREAQIEAALERVRAHAMSMHKTDELSNVINTLFRQLTDLGLKIVSSWVTLMHTERNELEIWMTHAMGNAVPTFVKTTEYETFEKEMQAWRDGQHISLEIPSNIAQGIVERVFKIDINPPADKPFWYLLQHWHNYGYIGLSAWHPATEEEKTIIGRFSKIFEQTYTRFLDIQKAEAQVREAQIEAALERVRSRAIAMRHSDELSEAAELLYKEFLKMGVESFSCGYLINDDEKQEWKIWLTNPGDPFFKQFWTCPYFADHNLKARYESWKRQEEFHCAVLEGEENRAHNTLISKYAPWKEAMLESLPPQLVFNSAHFSLGHLLVISPDRLSPDLEQAMARFAKVFDLAWRRFLDLEKAEVLAREEKIEAALDRVRAEIASMRSAEDLERITPLVWRELITLDVSFFRCGVFIMDEENERVHTYLSTPEGRSLAVIHLPFDSAETIRKTVEHWRRQKAYLDSWDKQQFVEWMQSLTEQGYITEGNAYQDAAQPPEALALHFVPFNQGMLYVGHSEKLPEAQIVLLQRLADAFAVAYSRYEDFSKLEVAKKQVESAFSELKSAQSQLIQSEKLASLGELTAGIAHEIQNPLNFVNNFSELSVDLIKEIQDEKQKTADQRDEALENELLNDLAQNQQKINHHGKRAAAIVTGMLQHARTSTGKKEPTDLNALADEYLRLAYHGLRAKDPDFEAAMVTDFDPSIGKVEVIPQDMGRVLLNLINNAFYAVQQRAKQSPPPGLAVTPDLPGFENLEGLEAGAPYQPTVTVSTQKMNNQIIMRVKDNGTGIPEAVKAKIFQPFFTTKPTGQGTGLGLSLAYDIVVKGHGGTLEVESREGEETTFKMILSL